MADREDMFMNIALGVALTCALVILVTCTVMLVLTAVGVA